MEGVGGGEARQWRCGPVSWPSSSEECQVVSMAHWAFVFGLCVAFCGRIVSFFPISHRASPTLSTHTHIHTHGGQMCTFLLPGLPDYDLIPGKGSEEKKNQLTS